MHLLPCETGCHASPSAISSRVAGAGHDGGPNLARVAQNAWDREGEKRKGLKIDYCSLRGVLIPEPRVTAGTNFLFPWAFPICLVWVPWLLMWTLKVEVARRPQ